MKKIRMSVGILFMCLMLMGLTACGRNTAGNGSGGTTTTQSATGGAMESTSPAGSMTNGTTGTGNGTGTMNETTGTHNGTVNGTAGTGETGTGVIGGLMNDMERGAENITGTTPAPTDGRR